MFVNGGGPSFHYSLLMRRCGQELEVWLEGAKGRGHLGDGQLMGTAPASAAHCMRSNAELSTLPAGYAKCKTLWRIAFKGCTKPLNCDQT